MKIPCKIKDIYHNEFGDVSINNYYIESDGIPPHLIIHGKVELHEKPDSFIVDKCGNFYIVNYLDSNNHRTQLGFLKGQLEFHDNTPRGYTIGDKLKFTFSKV